MDSLVPLTRNPGDRLTRALVLTAAVLALAALGRADSPSARGVDASLPAVEARAALRTKEGEVAPVSWVRLREHGVQFLAGADGAWRVTDEEKRQRTLAALQELQAAGIRVVSAIERNKREWPSGMHVKDGSRQIRDLRDAAALMTALLAAYEGRVDAWEVENEPDLGFVAALPEAYAAQLKAMYWGWRKGAGGPPPRPLLLMGALGLPPGPWLERFAENEGLSYTTGFNFHYYGYADDFAAVYLQHQAAAIDLGAALPAKESARRELPVFVTELGYGMLGPEAAATKEGRLRQWQWFRSVGEQVDRLAPEAALGFVLKPYLAYGVMQYGMTVPNDPSPPTYSPGDLGSKRPRSWMDLVGAELGSGAVTPALAWWLGAPDGRKTAAGSATSRGSRGWTVRVAEPSPVVIDFLPGTGLMPLKRFGGTFVTGTDPVRAAPDAAPRGPSLPPMTRSSAPEKPSRTEDFIVQVRTQNGNLFEVYPVRRATPQWQTFLEHAGNFTMAFYGRAALPWRFAENRPLSLVLVFYPRNFPAVYEFRNAELQRVGGLRRGPTEEARRRYGAGELVLYNFSERTVRGKLTMPTSTISVLDSGSAAAAGIPLDGSMIELPPMERRVLPVQVSVPGESFTRCRATILFEPDDPAVPPGRFVTEFFPALEGMRRSTIAELAVAGAGSGGAPANSARIARLKLAAEEAPRGRQPDGWFVQDGAAVAATADGFVVTITHPPSGKPQRVEVELPWPDDIPFPGDAFMSLDFRLGSEIGSQ
ncbi:MAG TPA: hypothetical protein VEB66_08690 [Opitutaceae bacterium]|nr:hypothetical protein [Opitutaceae bacterium]